MAERLPYPVFDRPLSVPTLTEAPRVLPRRPSHQTAVDSFNRGYSYLEEWGQTLEQRRLLGEFNTLGAIAAKIEAGSPLTPSEQRLMRDFGALLDSRDARFGRRNINIARYVGRVNDSEVRGTVPSPHDQEIRDQYQSGDFHLIAGPDIPLNRNSGIDRFVVPIRDGNKSFAVLDGAPVEGIIREIDRRIGEVQNRGHMFGVDRYFQLRGLRHDRDVLFTSSTAIFEGDLKISHARKQYEAKLKSEDPLLSEWQEPDWYKIELSLRDRRVLDLQRGRNRLVWLPLLAVIPLVAWGLQTCTPTVAPVPAPVVITNPCYQVEGGKLRTESFDLTEDPNPSSKGANQREMYYQFYGLSQRNYLPNDDPDLIAGVEALRKMRPDYYDGYLKAALEDERQTAQRIRGDQDESEWVPGTDFSRDVKMLSSCLSPEQRDQIAREVSSTNR